MNHTSNTTPPPTPPGNEPNYPWTLLRWTAIAAGLWTGWGLILRHETLDRTILGLEIWGACVALFLTFLKDSPGLPVFSGTALQKDLPSSENSWLKPSLLVLLFLGTLRFANQALHQGNWLHVIPALVVLGILFWWAENPAPDAGQVPAQPSNPGQGWVPWHVAAILAAGGFFLFHRLEDWPDIMWRDGALTLLCGLNFFNGNSTTPYFTDWGENPSFSFMLIGMAFKVGGVSYLTAAKFIILVNLVGFVFFYGAARFYLSRSSALTIALVFATSRWIALYAKTPHDGVNIITAFEAAAFYFFIRAVELGRKRDFAIFGVLLGFILQIYLSSRFVLAFFLAATLILFILRPRQMFERKAQWALAWGLCALCFLPMAHWYFHHPDTLLGRIKEINVFQHMEQTGNHDYLWQNLDFTLRSFNVTGSGDPRFNLRLCPLLGPWEGIFLLAGIGWCLTRIFQPAIAILMAGFFGSLCTTVLTWDMGHPMRMLVGAPFVYIIVGIGVDRLTRLLVAPLVTGRTFTRVLLLMVFMGMAFQWNWDVFYKRYPQAQDTWTSVEGAHILAGKTIAKYPKGWDLYLPVGFAGYDTEQFFSHGRGTILPFKPATSLPLGRIPDKGALILLNEELGTSAEDWIAHYYPGVKKEPILNRFGQVQFWSWEIEPAQVEKALTDPNRTVPPGGVLVSWFDPGGVRIGQTRIANLFDLEHWDIPGNQEISRYEVTGWLWGDPGKALALEAFGTAEIKLGGIPLVQLPLQAERKVLQGVPRSVEGGLPLHIVYRKRDLQPILNLYWNAGESWQQVPATQFIPRRSPPPRVEAAPTTITAPPPPPTPQPTAPPAG